MSAVLNPEASVQVLRNAGIPVKTYTLAKTTEGTLVLPYTRVMDEVTGDPLLEWRYVRISNAVLAAIETPEPTGWGSVTAWEKDLEDTPFRSIARTLALCWSLFINVDGLGAPDIAQAAAVLLDGEIESYSLAIGNAFLLAQGVDPQRVGEHLREEIRSLETQAAAISDLVEKQTEQTVERRNAFVAAQKQQSDSASDEPTPTSPSPSLEDQPSSEPSPPGSGPDMTLVRTGT